MQNVIDFEAVFNAANRAYVARNPEKGEALQGKMQADIASGLQTFKSFSPGMVASMQNLGIDAQRIGAYIGACSNVKVARRIPQFIGFIVSANPAFLQGSAKVALLEYCALHAGAKSKDALRFASTGKGNESTSDEISVIKARAVLKAFGAVNGSSRETQASVTFSKGGILDAMGMVTPWAKGATMPALIDCATGRALGAILSALSDSTIELWANYKGKK